MLAFLKNVLTSRDNLTYSMTKIMAASGTAALIYNFVTLHSSDFQGFAVGMSAMVTSLAAKYYVEKDK